MTERDADATLTRSSSTDLCSAMYDRTLLMRNVPEYRSLLVHDTHDPLPSRHAVDG